MELNFLGDKERRLAMAIGMLHEAPQKIAEQQAKKQQVQSEFAGTTQQQAVLEAGLSQHIRDVGVTPHWESLAKGRNLGNVLRIVGLAAWVNLIFWAIIYSFAKASDAMTMSLLLKSLSAPLGIALLTSIIVTIVSIYASHALFQLSFEVPTPVQFGTLLATFLINASLLLILGKLIHVVSHPTGDLLSLYGWGWLWISVPLALVLWIVRALTRKFEAKIYQPMQDNANRQDDAYRQAKGISDYQLEQSFTGWQALNHLRNRTQVPQQAQQRELSVFDREIAELQREQQAAKQQLGLWNNYPMAYLQEAMMMLAQGHSMDEAARHMDFLVSEANKERRHQEDMAQQETKKAQDKKFHDENIAATKENTASNDRLTKATDKNTDTVQQHEANQAWRDRHPDGHFF